MRLNSLAGCAVVFFALAIPASPATLIITNTNDSGPGSLRDTLEIANDGDTITFAVTGSIVLTSGELLVDKSIIITAPGASNLAVDGNATSRVFYVAPGRTVSITGLTVANGTVSGDPLNSKGGGIYNDQATLTLNSCTVTGNLAGYGGGISATPFTTLRFWRSVTVLSITTARITRLEEFIMMAALEVPG